MAENQTPAYQWIYAGAAPRGHLNYQAPQLRTCLLQNCLQHNEKLQRQIDSLIKKSNTDGAELQNQKMQLETKQKEHEAKEQELLEECKKHLENNKKKDCIISNTLQRLEKQVAEKDAIELQYQVNLHKLVAQLEEAEDKLVKQQEEQLLKASELEQINATMSKNYQQKLDELREQLCQKEDENMQLHKDTQRLTENLTQVSAQLLEKDDEKTSEVKEAEDEKTRLQEENRKLVEDNQQLEDKKTKLENEKKILVKEKKDLENEMKNLEEDKTELEQHCLKKMEKKLRGKQEKKDEECDSNSRVEEASSSFFNLPPSH